MNKHNFTSGFITRREMLGHIALAGIAMAVPYFLYGAAEDVSKKPNVLLIAVDDLNEYVGCLGGHPQALTPNIDALAARGMLFSNAHCSAPVCTPSRTSLLFGISPSTSGITNNRQTMRTSPVLANADTLPQYLRAHGYTTASYGKVFEPKDPDPQSWDDLWVGVKKKAKKTVSESPAPATATPADGPWKGAGGPLDVSDDDMPDANYVRHGITFLEQKHEKPFFLAVGIKKPHMGWSVPRKYHEMFPADKVQVQKVQGNLEGDRPAISRKDGTLGYRADVDARVQKYHQEGQIIGNYLASTAFADAMVGRVLDALKRTGHEKDTVVILWGDNGHHFGEKGRWSKSTLWEGSTRIPLIYAGPGTSKGVCNRPLDNMAFYPTVVELCGLPPAGKIEGASVVSLLQDPKAKWDRPAITTAEGVNHSVRTERWRYIRYGDGSEELYDHDADPQEWKNLAADPRYDGIRKELADWLPKNKMPEVPSSSNAATE
jgi:arylsulfatase A-like enzyme